MTNKNNQNRVVWAEIPVLDMTRAVKFYEHVLGAPLHMNTDGPVPVAILPSPDQNCISGNLVHGTPAKKGTGSIVHLNATCDLETAKKRVIDGGGDVMSDTIQIPTGAFFFAADTEGNSIGFFRY